MNKIYKVIGYGSVYISNNMDVGDLWILAGQSNMEGAGKLRSNLAELEINTDSEVRCYYMSESWAPAKPQLHQIWEIKEDYY